MPELPEVEVMTSRLQRWVGYQIVTADSRHHRYLPDQQNFLIMGQSIRGVFRRGKFIIFMLDDGALLCHNAMSGYWNSDDDPWIFHYVEGDRSSKDSDVRVCILLCKPNESLSQTGRNLFFHDARKFGSLKYVSPDELAKKLSELGPEAMETKHLYEPRTFHPASFMLMANSSKKPIKELLMDQTKISGVGNIYAAEACYRARVSPFRRACDLTSSEQIAVLDGAKETMSEALQRGLDYSHLNVYRRDYCGGCNAPIKSEKLKGRSTYWCPSCQK